MKKFDIFKLPLEKKKKNWKKKKNMLPLTGTIIQIKTEIIQ